MSNTHSKDSDEIDLRELFKTLWDGKWIISVFVFLSVLFGIGMLLTQKISYESRLTYKKDELSQPPFFKSEQVDRHFNDKFFSEITFKDWKSNNENTSLNFGHIDLNEVVDGVVTQKNGGAELVEIVNNYKQGFILIKTNQMNLLDDIYNYARYVNDILSVKYLLRAQKELNIIEQKCNGIYRTAFKEILFLERFKISIKEGKRMFAFEHPTKPKRLSLNTLMVFVSSALIGGMMGVFYVMLRELFNKYKNM